jgi:hypothetical protein
LLIAIATLLLGSLIFFFDYWRLSVLFFGLVTVGFMYLHFKVDHFFHITSNKKSCSDQKAQAIPHGNGGSSTDFGDFVGRRLERQTVDEPLAKHTLVIVCASGGGDSGGWLDSTSVERFANHVGDILYEGYGVDQQRVWRFRWNNVLPRSIL